MRPLLMLFMLCVPLLLWADSVTLRAFDLELTPEKIETRQFEHPAWRGRTRLVCPRWGVPWSVRLFTAAGDTVVVDFACVEEESGFFEKVPALAVAVRSQGREYTGILPERRGLKLSNNDCMVAVAWELNRGLSVSCGGNIMLADLPLGSPVIGLALSAPQPVAFVEWLTDAETVSPLLGSFSREAMAEMLSEANDTITGVYDYFDRDTEPSLAQPGGDYSLLLLPVGSGSYALCYLGGATVNAGLWKPGMVKGIISPTEFESHWTLRWLDAGFREVNAEQYLFFPGGNLIQAVFPLYRSKLRLVRNSEKSLHPRGVVGGGDAPLPDVVD